MEAVAEFAAAGGPVLGICNGFQVLCEAGLLPGALLLNENLRFICRQVDLIEEPSDAFSTPGGHQSITRLCRSRSSTGKAASGRPRRCSTEIEAQGQVAYRYAPGQNPNGSARDIAGVRNEAGNVLGLMPHPEHAVDPLTGSTDGLQVFEALTGSPA